MQWRFKTHWRVFWQLRKIQLMRLFELRANFFFWTLVSGIWTVFNIFFFSLISRVNTIGGWNESEMYVLLAIFTIIDAFTWSFFYHSMQMYTESIFSGDLNLTLLKPIDTQFFIMTKYNSYTNIVRLLMGIGLLFWAVPQTGVQVSFLTATWFICVLTVSLLFIWHFWFILSTLAFWVERLNNINEVIPSFRRAWQVPRSVYTGIASLVMTVVIPLGLITSIPTEVLLGKTSWPWLLYFLAFAGVTIIFSRWFFYFSLKRFSGIAN